MRKFPERILLIIIIALPCLYLQPVYATDDSCTVMLASDYQDDTKAESYDNLNSILKALKKNNITVDDYIICGDYTKNGRRCNYDTSPDDRITEIESLTGKYYAVDNKVFVQGNHNQMTDSITETGLHEYPSYGVYVVY